MNDCVLQQIPIPEHERAKLKEYAEDNDMKIFELTAYVLEWYFAERQITDKTRIMSSPKTPNGNKYWSLWVTESHFTKIEEVAKEELCSNNRVIYSAFKNWLNLENT